ncbi:MAG TPA: hypothetical protein VJ021_00350, partial [Thermoplasmata archaeon]|nr:hypothetical protein [Thermoplasmata archaeon]
MQTALPQVTEEDVPYLLPSRDPVQLDDEGVYPRRRNRYVLPDGETEPLLKDIPAGSPQGPELVRVFEHRESLPRAERSERRAHSIEPLVGFGGFPRFDLEQ